MNLAQPLYAKAQQASQNLYPFRVDIKGIYFIWIQLYTP